jgi:hypothetical protein
LPYADAFVPNLKFCITWVSKGKCKLSCHIGVKWLKSIMVKSMVNKAALKGMSDTIAALLPIVKDDTAKLRYPSGKVPEEEARMDKEAANAKVGAEALQAKESETAYTKILQENKFFSWISHLSNLTMLQIAAAAIGITLLIWLLQVSTRNDKTTMQKQVVHSRAVYLRDIEKELIDAKPSLDVSER